MTCWNSVNTYLKATTLMKTEMAALDPEANEDLISKLDQNSYSPSISSA